MPILKILSFALLANTILMEAEKTGPGRLSWKKRIFFKLLLVMIGTFFGLLIVEVLLRAGGYSYPEFYTVDESRGYALSPNMKGWYRKEGEGFIAINSDGLRDEEHAVAKPANTLRIAVIGDSYAEALQVSIQETFWKIMQEKLKGCGAAAGRQVEVINFGVSGYGTAQEFITLREQAWKYSPDIVILAITTNNDITDNYRPFKRTEIPYFVHQGGELALDDSFRNSRSFKFKNSYLSRTGGWIRDHVRVIQAIQESTTILKYKYLEWSKKPAETQVSANASAKPPANSEPVPEPPKQLLFDVGIDNQIYRIPADENWKEAWHVTEDAILKVYEEVRQKNKIFLAVTLSNGAQVYPDPKARAEFMEYARADDIFYPDTRIRNFAEAHSVPVLTLAPSLQKYAEQNQVILHGFEKNLGFGHWNQAGHRAAGEILGDHFCRMPELSQ